MGNKLSVAEVRKRKAAMEEDRKKKLAEARAFLAKEDWPESEHQARFEAAIKCALFANKIR